jgi:hypothetical protein
MNRKREKGRLPPFVPLLKDTLNSPAWRAMSHGARSLFVALKLRYSSNFKNNGSIYLSTRDAAQELGSGLEEVGQWFRELQHYGFIVQTQAGRLGVEGKGLAPHWCLTELGYMADPPTRDFARWNGVKFQRRKRPSRRGHKAERAGNKSDKKTESRSAYADHPDTGMLISTDTGMLITSAPD